MTKHPRTIAREAGKQLYETGKPCKRGHIAPRFVSTSVCTQCAKEVYNVKDRDNYRSGNTLKRQFATRKQVAKRQNIPFTITFEELIQPTHCPVFGIELDYEWSGEYRRNPNKATIDKVVPELGYVPGNVFVISWRANKLKCNMTLGELESILRYIKENKSNGESF